MRYHVAAYMWSPDSKHLLFDSQGQLWYYSLDTGTAVQLTSSPDPSEDPKFSPDGKRLVYVRNTISTPIPSLARKANMPLSPRKKSQRRRESDCG